jgi:hypothetical protein
MRCRLKHTLNGGAAADGCQFSAVYIQVSPAAEALAVATASVEPPSSAAAVSPAATASSETMAASRNLPSSKT